MLKFLSIVATLVAFVASTPGNYYFILIQLHITIVFLVDKSLFKPIPLGEKIETSDGRIVGGVAVDIVDYPWQLSLQEYGIHACGASIISSTWGLTAAHCVE